MTNDEKAKAYDEALERAKEFHHPQSTTIRGIIEEIFPELRESEDEQSRKKIEQLIRLNTSGAEKNQLLAYLEKHKEQNELPLMDCYADLYFDEWNLHKQNPTKRQCFKEGMRYARRLQKEQKQKSPTYLDLASNEFEACMLRYLQSAANRKDDAEIMIDTKGYAKQLLNIARKEQKPVEWSEEDEAILDSVIRIITHFDDLAHEPTFAGPKWTHPYTKEIAWLESLRPSWKPSEEQMDRLFSIIVALRKDYCDDMADFLASLYKQLKKL